MVYNLHMITEFFWASQILLAFNIHVDNYSYHLMNTFIIHTHIPCHLSIQQPYEIGMVILINEILLNNI